MWAFSRQKNQRFLSLDKPRAKLMKKNKRIVWDKILLSSAKMTEVAERNDWELLEELVLQRKILLSEFFSEPIVRDRHLALEQIRKDISQILEHDELTKSNTQSNKDAVLNSLQKMQKGKAAIKMYS
ncbi:MAG: hypothetical protein ACJA2D_002835 [Pseudohongiellaceae bacterium]|jgi:hypothetical protein